MMKLIANIKAKNFKEVDKEIAKMTIKWKAQVYVLSSIILNGEIPNNWKIIVKGGLFIDEKPYLGF